MIFTRICVGIGTRYLAIVRFFVRVYPQASRSGYSYGSVRDENEVPTNSVAKSDVQNDTLIGIRRVSGTFALWASVRVLFLED